MKTIFKIIFLLLIGLNAKSQNPSGVPAQNSTSWYRQGWHQTDSGEIIAPRIPNFTPKYPGTTILYQQNGVDTSLHYWTGLRWIKINSTGFDTTSLSNRINLKLNISDTTGKWLAQSSRLVDTMYRVNDSTVGYTIKGNPYTFQILGRSSGGGGGGSGTVTSVGLSMPSAFSVTGSPITSSGTLSVSGAGTTSQYIRGNGTLATFDTTAIPNFYLKVRGLLSGTSPITFSNITGQIGINNANTSGTKGAASFTSSGFSDNGSGLIDLKDLLTAGSCTGCELTIDSKGRITSFATGPGGATNNTNIGTGFRPVNAITQEMRTYFGGFGIRLDSVSNADGITWSADTSRGTGLPTYYYIDSLPSENISNTSLTANGNYTQNWNNKQWYVDSIAGQFLFRMGGIGSTGTRRKDFRINWGGSSFGNNLDGYNIMTTINKADNSGDSLRLGLISSGTGVLSMGYYDVANSANNTFISYSQSSGLINISAKDSIWIKGVIPAAAADSALGLINRGANGTAKLVKFPISTGGVPSLNNIGSGYRWVATPSGNIKTGFGSNTITVDSSSNTNGLTFKVDTSEIATQFDATYFAGNGVDITNKVVSQLFVPLKSGTPIVGNSISNGCCPDGTYISWHDTLSASFLNNISVSNLSVSGMGVRKGAYQLYTNFGEAHSNVPIVFEVGFNNTRILTDTAVHNATIQAAYRSMVASQFVTHIEAPQWGASGTNPNVTFSNTTAPASSEDTLLNWQSRLYWFRHNSINTGANWFNKASCNNDTITIASMIGTTLAFGTFAYYNTAGSRIKINVDGVDVVTYDPSNRTYLGQAEGYTPDGIIPDAIIINGLTNVSHIVKVIFIDNGKRGALDWFASLCSAQESYDRPAYVFAFPHMNSTGYNYPGGETTQGILDSATTGLKNMLRQTFPSYAIAFVNQNAPGYYDPSDASQIDADGIHPTSEGQYNWAKAIYASMLKSDRGSSGGDLDATLALGNTSSRQILLTGNNTTNSNMEVGSDISMQVYAPSVSWIGSNMKFNGSNNVYIHNGEATQWYLNNIGYMQWLNTGSGTAGSNANMITRMSIRPDGNIDLGGAITTSSSGAGSALQINSSTLNINTTGLEVAFGPTAYNLSYPVALSAVGPQPLITLHNNLGASDEKKWDFTAGSNTLNMRMAKDDYSNAVDWLTVTRSGYTSAKTYFPSGEVNIGNSTDQGAYTLQNTGGLYQNGTIRIQPLTAPPSTYNVIVHGLTDSTLYQVPVSALGSGIGTLNTLTASSQSFATGTSGTDFNISSSTATHTFNIPSASTSNRGLVTTSSQTFGGQKTFNNGLIATSSSGPRVTINGDITVGSPPSTSGAGLLVDFFTYTNTAAAGTDAGTHNFHFIANPTLASSNAITYSGDVATIRFAAAPTAGTNTTINHPWNILANDVNFMAGLARALNEQSGNATIANASGVNIYTGTGGHTFTLPALSTHPGKFIFIKNAGSGNLSVSRAGSDNIYNTSSVTSITVAAGADVMLAAGSSFWYVIGM